MKPLNKKLSDLDCARIFKIRATLLLQITLLSLSAYIVCWGILKYFVDFNEGISDALVWTLWVLVLTLELIAMLIAYRKEYLDR